MGPLLHSLPSLPFPNRKKSQIACKRETKLLPRDVLTQHLICKVGPLPLDLRKCTTTTKKESKPSPLKLLSFFLKAIAGFASFSLFVSTLGYCKKKAWKKKESNRNKKNTQKLIVWLVLLDDRFRGC